MPEARRWHYGLAAAIAFIMVGVFGPQAQKNPAEKVAKASATGEKVDEASTRGPAPTPEVKTAWSYTEDRDEMRDATRRFAELQSENSVDLQFPYGEQSAFITLRRDPQHGFDIMFRVRSGQILCHSFTDAYVNAKFDDGPIRKFSCDGSSDGTSEVAFIRDNKNFLKALRSSKKAVIEAEFYQNGRVQYVFNTRGLEWE
jgi:hypothetical protein